MNPFHLLATLLLPHKPRPRERAYRYKYLRYPFDDLQYFSVRAPSQEAADALAKDEYAKMFNAQQTTMLEFWAIRSR